MRVKIVAFGHSGVLVDDEYNLIAISCPSSEVEKCIAEEAAPEDISYMGMIGAELANPIYLYRCGACKNHKEHRELPVDEIQYSPMPHIDIALVFAAISIMKTKEDEQFRSITITDGR